MDRANSPYYPPRATVLSRCLRDPWFRVRRCIGLEKLEEKVGAQIGLIFAAMVIPGLGLAFARRALFLKAFCIAYPTGLLIVFAGLGSSIGNLAFGALISMHVSSFLLYYNLLNPGMELAHRLTFSLVIMGCISLGLYMPARAIVTSKWLIPVAYPDRVVVVNGFTPISNIKVGDWVAYKMETTMENGVAMRGGTLLDRVLGKPGDTITYSPRGIRVNGAFMGRLAYHPKTGEVVVPPGNWYIWPTMKTVVNRMVRQEVISEVIAGRALVSEKQIIGRPFETWFGRKQILR